MKGSNTLELNEATLIAALQLYFDNTFREGEAPTVTSIAGITVAGGLREFKVGIREREGSNAG